MADEVTDDDVASILGPRPVAPDHTDHVSDDDVRSILGPRPVTSWDDFGAPMPNQDPEYDQAVRNSSIGKVLDAFGSAVSAGWDQDKGTIAPVVAALGQKLGFFDDVKTRQDSVFKTANQAFLYGPAALIDTAIRSGNALLGGITQAGIEAVHQAGTAVGGEQFGRGVAGMAESMLADAGSSMAHGGPADIVTATKMGRRVPLSLEDAQGAHAIGVPESVYMGNTPAPEANPAAALSQADIEHARKAANDDAEFSITNPVGHTAPDALGPGQATPSIQPYAPSLDLAALPEAPATDVHGLARQIAPETFQEFDGLQAHQATLRQQIAEQTEALRQQAEAQAPHAAEIADLEQRLQDTTPRLAKKYQARLDALRPEHDAFLNDEFTMAALARDTPEIGALRQQLAETDYRMRDLAPGVTEAYRQASERLSAGPAPSLIGEPNPAAAPVAAAERVPTVPVAAEPTAPAKAVEAPLPVQPTVLTRASLEAQSLSGGSGGEVDAAKMAAAFHDTIAAAVARGDAVTLETGEGKSIPLTSKDGRTVQASDGAGVGVIGALSDRRASIRITPKVAERVATEMPKQPELTPVANPSEPTRPAAPSRPVPASIAADVSRKLQAAGRPAEEAEAAGQVTEAMWRTYADAWPGRGTAEELYARDAPDIRPGREVLRVRQPEMAQGGAQGKIRLTEDGRSIISLMKSANASTFLHETGHDWLERIMRDAAALDAPAAMKADASAVRSYLGTDEGKPIPTRAHEKFARSFERYFMEGRAPTEALAGVFAKFKDWLTAVYQSVAKLRAPITPDIRDVFDRLLTRNPEARAAIVPERAADLFEPEAPGQLPTNAAAGKPTPLYPKPPKEPTRLISYLRKEGGVRDEGGELASMLGGPKVRPGLIKDTGMSLDEATIRAHEAGYFPEKGETIPTQRELLDAIESDLRGEPKYSVHDSDDVAAYHAAIDHNAEIERLSHDHGIDTTGMTREQFFEALSNKASEQKFYDEIKSMEDAHEESFGEFAAEAREWAEDHYGHYDSNEIYGIDGPRTEQELETGYGSENTARPAGQGVSSDAQPGTAAGPAEPGEDGGGQGGRGAGDAGRPRQETDGYAARVGAGDQPDARIADPGEPFRGPAEPILDKAGNIRTELLNTPEDVNQYLREVSAQNNDFMAARRGVVTDQDVIAMADAINASTGDVNIAKLRAMSLEDGLPLAARIKALRMAVAQQGAKVRSLMEKAVKSGAAEDAFTVVQENDRMNMIQETLSAVTAEWGRAGRAFHDLANDVKAAGNMADVLKDVTGRDLFQMQKQMKAALAMPTPAALAKMVRQQAAPSLGDKLLELVVNGLISNPSTHATYMAGQAILAGMKAVPETALSAVYGSILPRPGKFTDRVYMGEVGAQLHGMIAGQRNGIQAAYEAGLTGLTTPLPGEASGQAQMAFMGVQRPGGAIGGTTGEVIRLPARGVAMIHSYNRAIIYSQDIATQAYRQAANEGLDGTAFAVRVADLTQNPTPEMMEAARDQATTLTLMGKGGDLTNKVSQLTNARFDLPVLGSTQLLKFIDPFVKIGANVMNQALLERSPLGLLDRSIRENLSGINGGVARDAQLARITVGTAIMTGLGVLAHQGLATGSGPTDPQARDLWMLAGNQSYSVRVGDTWYGYHRLGSFGMLMGVGADLYDVAHTIYNDEFSKAAGLLVTSVAKNLMDESFMRGPSDLMRAIDNPDRYGARWASSFATMFIPFSSAVKMLARSTDPYQREARGIIDSLKMAIPVLSQTLPARVDVFGVPMATRQNFPFTGASAITESQINDDPVVAAMNRTGAWPGPVKREINGVKLTENQHTDFAMRAGEISKQLLDYYVRMPSFAMMPLGEQDKLIRQAFTSGRAQAEAIIKARDFATSLRDNAPSIVQRSMANKAVIATQGRAAAKQTRETAH